MNRNNMGRGPGVNGGNNNNSNNTNIIRNIPAPVSSTSTNGLPLSIIGDLRPNMRGFNIECILLEKAAEPRRTQIDQQLVNTFLVADKTGSILLIVWGEEGAFLRSGDLLRVQGGETKIFRGLMQLATSKFGKYKKIGEDTMLFIEKPNWSEFEWMQDPNGKLGVMIPINPQNKMPIVMNGVPAMIPGGSMNSNMQQQQQRNMPGHNPQAALAHPPFRGGDQRQSQRPPFPPNQVGGPSPNGIPHGNPMPGPNVAPGFLNNNNVNKVGFGGPGGMQPNPMQHQQQQQMPPQQQQQQHNMNGLGQNGSSIGPGLGPGSNRGHHVQHQNQNNLGNNSQNQGLSGGAPSANAGAGGSGGGRHNKHNKHGKMHRDLDAPDTYPSPRTGLANSADEFARDMKLVSSHGGVGLGVGGAVPGHMRKKPKVELD